MNEAVIAAVGVALPEIAIYVPAVFDPVQTKY